MKLATADGIDLAATVDGAKSPFLKRMKGLFGDAQTAGPRDFASSRFNEFALDLWETLRDQLERYDVQVTEEAIRRISRFERNWDGMGSDAPSQLAASHALTVLPQLYRLAVAASSWVPPHVSASEEGEITFEWWYGSHKVTMYISEARVEFVRVWGADIDREMDSGELQLTQFPDLWKWLRN